jgi:lipopolysaccharide transport system ATP-binding protein
MGQVHVEGLGKAYKQYPNRWVRLAEFLLPGSQPRHHLHWVLRDVSFSVAPGEALGVIGVNGAGKSTLLKMITGTTQPTTGSLQVTGRVAALLELGMGFHPDFTGRQNLFTSGQLQGLSLAHIAACLPEIERFADIGEYIDQPVRVYSSGMQVRLAFALATAVRPDILIVDEALSVGDAAFQRKCYQRIEAFRQQGTTLLFVTHDIDTVKKLCDRALFLEHGGVAALGAAKPVCDAYERALFGGGSAKQAAAVVETTLDPSLTSECEQAYGDGRASIDEVWLENAGGERANLFASAEPLVLQFRVTFHVEVVHAVFAFMIKTREGINLFGSDTAALPDLSRRRYAAGQQVTFRAELANAFAPGVYYLNCGVRDDRQSEAAFLHRRLDVCLFRVRNDEHTFVKSGLLNVPAMLTVANV